MVDVPGDSTTTASVTVGSTTDGVLEANGDHDWYRITLTAGQSITVNINGVTLEDPYLYIRDQFGNLLFKNDDINPVIVRNSQLAFSATYSGTYFIDVGAFDENYSGTYQVVVSTYTPPPLATNDQIANQLTSGYWSGDSHHFNVTQGGTLTVNISTLNTSEKALARAALAEWTDIIGVNFQEVTTGGQIVFDHNEDPQDPGPIAATNANWSQGIITSAHVQISTSWVSNYGTGLNTYSFQTYIHEIGHALGLGHAGNYNFDGTPVRYPFDAIFQNDAWATSVMSYFDQSENTYFAGQGFTKDFAVTPMIADIIAMQQLYGLSTTTRTGDTTYGYNSNAGSIYDASVYNNVAYTIFDSAGNDTLDFSGSSANQLINLNPETFSNVNGDIGNLAIARGVTIENAIGGLGSDTIIGNSANNILTGRGGADTLTGGAGNDIFRDTKAGLNGDTIADFGSGDKIVFTDAALAGFTFSISGHTLTYSGGSLTLTNIPAGIIVASAAVGGGVQLALQLQHDPDNDFNGDGKSDILWRSDAGQLGDWLGQNGGNFSVNPTLVGIPAEWHVAGTGDFNGDGRDDILWRSDAGQIGDWLGQLDGNFSVNPTLVGVPSSWQVAGTGDFNGDGRDDILWRSDTGQLGDWLGQTNGNFAVNPTMVGVPTSWHVVGTGDFNGDGKDDILWQSDAGQIGDWLGNADGTFTVSPTLVGVPSSWHVVGTGDFNGDGRDDILWRSDAGQLGDWLGQTDGSFAVNPSLVGVPTGWHVADVGDYNGDSRDDILWRSDAGQVGDWFGQGDGSFAVNPALSGVPGSWHIQSPDNFWL